MRFTNFDEYRGQTVLVTGASSGIGLAIATELYKAGANLILVGRSRKALTEKVESNLLPHAGLHARPAYPEIIECDMNFGSDEGGMAILEAIRSVAPGGKLNACIFSAGLSMREIVMNMSSMTEQYIMSVNYSAPTILSRLMLKHQMIVPHGRIAVISSLQGLLATPFRSTYTASKHAVQAYFTSLRHELAILQSNITITIISPGYVLTNLSRNALVGSGEKHNKLDENTAHGMLPSEVAILSLSAILRRYSDLWLCPYPHQLIVYIQYWSSTITSYILQKRGRKELPDLLKRQ